MELYTILAEPDATVKDVTRMAVEIYLNEDHPPAHIKVESLGIDPAGKGVWSVEVPDPSEDAQEALTGDEPTNPDSDAISEDQTP